MKKGMSVLCCVLCVCGGATNPCCLCFLINEWTEKSVVLSCKPSAIVQD